MLNNHNRVNRRLILSAKQIKEYFEGDLQELEFSERSIISKAEEKNQLVESRESETENYVLGYN
ncbi:MAG: hypothetical protein MJK12_00345 [Colwellia sp.]|nr:hypothetical protein [Colwellia sp.]